MNSELHGWKTANENPQVILNNQHVNTGYPQYHTSTVSNIFGHQQAPAYAYNPHNSGFTTYPYSAPMAYYPSSNMWPGYQQNNPYAVPYSMNYPAQYDQVPLPHQVPWQGASPVYQGRPRSKKSDNGKATVETLSSDATSSTASAPDAASVSLDTFTDISDDDDSTSTETYCNEVWDGVPVRVAPWRRH